jgi:hypothetical protein
MSNRSRSGILAVTLSANLISTLLSVTAVVASSRANDGMKEFENRFEGTAGKPHGNEDLELLGIHRVFDKFSRGANLRVQFYLPTVRAIAREASVAKRVFLEAVEIQDTMHYSMRSKERNWDEGKWNTFEPWPTKDVIDPLGLDPTNIAVLAGYRDDGGVPTYLPVDVLETPRSVGRPYTFHFRTALDLHSLEKSMVGPSGQVIPLKTEECKFSPSCVRYPAASSQAFEVDMSGLSEGIYVVRVTGHVPRTVVRPTLTIRLYHMPS